MAKYIIDTNAGIDYLRVSERVRQVGLSDLCIREATISSP